MSSKKNYNTTEYRSEKKIIVYVSPSLKKTILESAKRNERTISSEVNMKLLAAYGHQ